MAEVGSLFVRLRADASEFEAALSGIGGQFKNHGKQAQQLGGDITKYVTAPILGIGLGSGAAAIDFESAWAGVLKTVDGTPEELDELRSGIQGMSKDLPASATEIAGVAEAAGQLGIEVPNILGFTRTMIDLGESTNMHSDEAAGALARLANITGMPQTEFGNLGSTVVELGNNLATTEGEIVDMGLRIAGAGSQIGLTEAEILGFAGALSSVGIESQAGGSAISRVMINMANAVATGGEDLDGFASVAGMTASEFAEAFEKDPANAIISFIEGLNGISESGGNVFGVLDDLGLSEIRVRDTLLRASGAGDLMRKSVDLGSKAWEENTALTIEAEQRYATTASQLGMLRNQFVGVATSFGETLLPMLRDQVIPVLETLIGHLSGIVQWFQNLPGPVQTAILIFAGILAAVGPLLVVFGTLGIMIGGAITAFGILAPVLAAVLSPIGLIVLAIAGLVAGFIIAYRTSETFRDIVNGAIGVVWAVVSEVVGLVKDLLSGDWQGAWDRASGWVESARDAIKTALPKIWDAIKGFVTETVPKIAGQLLTWATEFTAWIGPQIEPMLAELYHLLGSLIDWLLLTALPGIIENLAKWGYELVAWVAPQIPPLLLELGKLLLSIGEWIVNVAQSDIVGKLGSWGLAFLGFIARDVLPYIVGKLMILSNDIASWIVGTAAPEFIEKLKTWGGAFLDWIANDALPFIIGKLGALSSRITNWIAFTALPKIVTKLKDWASAFVDWVGDSVRDLPGRLMEIIAAIEQWARDNLSRAGEILKDIGKAIIDGLIGGIRDKIPSLDDVLGGITDAIPDWKGPLQKDRKLLQPTGMVIMEGLEHGIAAGAADVQRRLERLTNSMGGFGPHTAGAAGASGNGAPIIIRNEIGGRVVDEYIVDANNRHGRRTY